MVLDMDLLSCGLTHKGLVRKNNEDNFYVDPQGHLFIVCDGMGGHHAGEVASALCCEKIVRKIQKNSSLEKNYQQQGRLADLLSLKNTVEDALLTANEEIYKKSLTKDTEAGMGTTCSLLYLVGRGKAIIGHAGDSRIYLQRQQKLYHLTEDHTYVQELIKRAALSQEEAFDHPYGHILSKAIGIYPDITVDTWVIDIDPLDTLLICSDGLYQHHPEDDEINELLGQYHPKITVQSILEQLLKQSLERGGFDNCTGIVLRTQKTAELAPELTAHYCIETLLKNDLFQYLSYKDAQIIIGLCEFKKWHSGEFLVREKSTGHELILLLQGVVSVLQDQKLRAQLGPSSLIGEMALLETVQRTANIRAQEETLGLVLKRDVFQNILCADPLLGSKLLYGFMKHLQERIHAA